MELAASWYEDAEWRGYAPAASRSVLLAGHVFVTWVAGISYYVDAVDSPDFAPGREVVLRLEPDNPVDPNAIGVWNGAGTIQVGHVPAVIVRDLGPWSGERQGLTIGERVDAGHRLGLWIVIAREPAMLQIVEPANDRPVSAPEWVRRGKDAIRHSEDWRALKSGLRRNLGLCVR